MKLVAVPMCCLSRKIFDTLFVCYCGRFCGKAQVSHADHLDFRVFLLTASVKQNGTLLRASVLRKSNTILIKKIKACQTTLVLLNVKKACKICNNALNCSDLYVNIS